MFKTLKVLNTNIPYNKSVFIGIQLIYGIGPTRAKEIIDELGFQGNIRLTSLSEKNRLKLIKLLEEKRSKWLLEKDLKSYINRRIKLKIDIGSYQGLRHQLHLPVRGQRTHSNAKTQKKGFAKI